MRHLRLLSVAASALALMFGLGSIQPAAAATVGGSTTIGANIANTCSMGAVTNPGAPTLTGGVAPGEISGSFAFTCTASDTLTISLGVGNNGTGAGTASPTRAVKSGGGQTLAYGIYQGAGKTTLWGDDAGVNTKAVSGTGSAQSETFYVDFNTPALTLPAGSYTDTVAITISY